MGGGDSQGATSISVGVSDILEACSEWTRSTGDGDVMLMVDLLCLSGGVWLWCVVVISKPGLFPLLLCHLGQTAKVGFRSHTFEE